MSLQFQSTHPCGVRQQPLTVPAHTQQEPLTSPRCRMCHENASAVSPASAGSGPHTHQRRDQTLCFRMHNTGHHPRETNRLCSKQAQAAPGSYVQTSSVHLSTRANPSASLSDDIADSLGLTGYPLEPTARQNLRHCRVMSCRVYFDPTLILRAQRKIDGHHTLLFLNASYLNLFITSCVYAHELFLYSV